MKEIISHTADETMQQGIVFAQQLIKGDTIALFGDLGAGKTTFMQGLAYGLGVKKRVISPTYVLMREYKGKILSLIHIDLYRLEGEQAIENSGLHDILDDAQAVVAIEWAEKMKTYLPDKRFEIYFRYLSENDRKIQIRKYG